MFLTNIKNKNNQYLYLYEETPFSLLTTTNNAKFFDDIQLVSDPVQPICNKQALEDGWFCMLL